ncbi:MULTISPECIES: helix-turn-helix domain-containing protein [unclassified Nocardioides]|uniref:helix-turn-helix domain-containing protein n=1 Tax=unclassified Nocardioides TaxID=2615069 RepID=UPI0009E939FB|nr:MULTISPECIES: helix-turn-helix domain-containing protein [unclassified Nocardioides]
MLVEEAAAILRVAPDWLYRAARADRIPSVRMGRNVRFRPEDIRELRDHGLAFDE